jgi:hypothetical protein
MLGFLVWNLMFIYGKFQAQIDPLVAPHLAKVKAVAEQVLSKIPKYQKKEEKAEEKKDN